MQPMGRLITACTMALPPWFQCASPLARGVASLGLLGHLVSMCAHSRGRYGKFLGGVGLGAVSMCVTLQDDGPAASAWVTAVWLFQCTSLPTGERRLLSVFGANRKQIQFQSASTPASQGGDGSSRLAADAHPYRLCFNLRPLAEQGGRSSGSSTHRRPGLRFFQSASLCFARERRPTQSSLATSGMVRFQSASLSASQREGRV